MSAGYRDLEVKASGLRLHVGFALENRSHAVWTRAGKLSVGWQLYDPGSSAFLAEGEWSAVNQDMPPGTAHVLALPVDLPGEQGSYHVYISPRDERDGWFFEQHWPFVLIEARVNGSGAAQVDHAGVTTLGRLRRRQLPRKLRIAFLQPWQTLWRNRALIGSMARREITVRYRGSIGGVAWTVLHPLLLMLTYFFVFGLVLKSRFGGDTTQSGYALNFLAAQMAWLPFADAVGRAPSAMLEHRNFIKRLVFPVETIPVNHVLAGLVTQGFALLVFLALLISTRGLPGPSIAWLPALIAPQVMLTLGVAWFVSALGVYLRDLGQVIGFLLTLGAFLTPIFYPPEVLPSWALPVLDKSPMFQLVEMYRAVLVNATAPPLQSLALLWAVSATVFLAGHAWFWRLRKTFADVI